MTDQITQSIIVNRDVSDLYDIWADFENFPHFLEHIESITRTGERTSHWVFNGPLGIPFAWDVETTRLEENKRIAWSSKDNQGDIKTSGQVTFNALPKNQSEVTVTLQYVSPGGVIGDLATNMFSNPEERLAEDLRNFKAYAEERLPTQGQE